MDLPELTIIIPVFNEEANLQRIESEFVAFKKIAIKKFKVLFINDGSTDNSQLGIETICKQNLGFDYVEFDKNYGLSAALKAGFDFADTHLVGYIDADLQTQPKDFNLLLAHSENYELVTGFRANRKDSLIKKISSKIANFIRKLFTNDGMIDTGCPLKIIHSDSAKKIPMFRGMHRFIPALILLQNGRVKQLPIMHFPRIAGVSKFSFKNRFYGPFLDCFLYLWMKKKYVNYTICKTNKSLTRS